MTKRMSTSLLTVSWIWSVSSWLFSSSTGLSGWSRQPVVEAAKTARLDTAREWAMKRWARGMDFVLRNAPKELGAFLESKYGAKTFAQMIFGRKAR